jgi:peroxiredoxin
VKRLAQFEPYQDEIKQAGAQLVYIAAEKRGGMFKPARYLAAHPISFPFLLDEDRSVTKAYGLYHRFRHDAINIARPASLVVDRNATVHYIYRGASQTDRAPLNEILDAVRKLKVSD